MRTLSDCLFKLSAFTIFKLSVNLQEENKKYVNAVLVHVQPALCSGPFPGLWWCFYNGHFWKFCVRFWHSYKTFIVLCVGFVSAELIFLSWLNCIQYSSFHVNYCKHDLHMKYFVIQGKIFLLKDVKWDLNTRISVSRMRSMTLKRCFSIVWLHNS